ncbi:helix-turn-helix transcriptional regulator [Providencia sp. PROV261]|uniref:helix-turn-helix transcriptional regulator n=1 Tax=Providencia sp. PROV261 TaxID=2949949 RepID=UPI00234B3F26|nr:AlpA family transcriptional regulator [Providencia sp. PROV261]
MTNPIETSTATTPSLLNDQFIDMKFITQLTGLTDKWFYKLIQDGEFPKPIKLGRSSRWLKSEVEQWLQARIDESRSPDE